jgi:hypothetical protein
MAETNWGRGKSLIPGAHETEATVEATAQRAAEHAEACHARLSTFASLDSEVDACLIGQLREAGRVELPDELRTRSLQRQEARDALAAAEGAHTTLQRERVPPIAEG